MKKNHQFILLGFLLVSFSANGQEGAKFTSMERMCSIKKNTEGKVKFSYTVFELSNETYGYDILANGVIYFHQKNMPGKSQDVGFSTYENAKKVALLVIQKLENPIILPFVSLTEMKLLNIE